MNINTWNLRTPLQFSSLTLPPRAVLAWAAVLAVALLSFFVNVLHEQVQRGESFRAQFHGGSRLAQAQRGSAHVVTSAEARLSRRVSANQ